jgi:cytidylate kinase
MDKLPNIIAIDGPSASGKSTLAKRIADELEYLYFDTGIMYRAITWLAQQQLIDPRDERAITILAEQAQIDVRPPSNNDGRSYDVKVDEQDITWEIRQPQVEASVSIVSAYAGVRQALTRQQRRIAMRGKVVMVGRDIGTVVLPEADLKIYLDASVEERARRRYQELQQRGEVISFDDLLASMRMRDRIDSTREIAPLRPAPDAFILNSDGLNIDQVVDTVRRIIAGKNLAGS